MQSQLSQPSKFKIKPLALAITMASASFVLPVKVVQAQEEVARVLTVDISAGSLSRALNQLAKLAKVALSYDPDLAAGKTTLGVKGSHTLEQALDKLLQGSGVGFNRVGDKVTLTVVGEVAMLDTIHVAATAEKVRFGDALAETGGFKAGYQSTATKMAMSLKETPQAISVVTRESLEARQVKDIATAVELTAGVSGTNRGAPGPFAGHGQFGRGFSLRGQELQYYRDVRADGFSAGVLSAFDFAAYERVEVVKGPSGFYGQGSLGGYINLVRKKPQKEFSASVSGQAGSYDTYRGEADITGALTEDKRLRGRLVAAYDDAGSFTDDVKTETTLFAPSIEAEIGDHTRVLLQFLYQEEDFIPSRGMPIKLEGNKLEALDIPRSFYFGAVGSETSDASIRDVSLRVDHELSDRWLATLLLQRNKTGRHVIFNNAGFQSYTSGIKHNTETEVWAGELRLEGEFDAFGREHQLLFGVEKNQRMLELEYGYGFLGMIDIYANNFSDVGFMLEKDVPTTQEEDNVEKNSAVYGQTFLSLHERTKLLLSARYDWSDKENKLVEGSAGEQKKSALTMRIGLVQTFTDNISAYATYGQSFNPVSSTGKNGRILDPETGDGYELGLKTDWFNHKLGATLAVYQQELDDRPITDPESLLDAIPGTYSMSAGKHRTEGVELEITGTPYQGLTIAAAANWSDNEFIDKDDTNYELSINGSIDKQYSLYANYELQGGPLKGLGFGATLVSVGERQYIIGGKQAYLDGYERVDLNFSYNGLPNWEMALQVRNLFDKTYVEQAQSGYRAAWNFFGAPRSALFKATYHF